MKTKSQAKKLVFALLAVIFVLNCLLAACGSTVTIRIQTSGTEIAKGQTISVVALASDGSDCNLSVSNPELVVLNGGVLSVVTEPATDTVVTVTATLASDASVKATKEITVKAAIPQAPTVTIVPSCTELTLAQYAEIQVIVSDNSAYDVTLDNSTLVHYYNGRVVVDQEPDTDTAVTLTVVTKGAVPATASVVLTVKAKTEKPTMVMTTTAKEISETSPTAEFKVAVAGNLDYTLSVIKGADYVTLDQATGTVTWNAQNLTVDTYITVKATLDSDPTVNTSYNLVIRAKRVEGKVIGANGIELNNAKINAIANASITVTGTLTDYYIDITKDETTATSYTMSVKMSDGAWMGEWLAAGLDESNLQVDNYRKGTTTGSKDALGADYHYFNRLYINKNNVVASKPLTDSYSQPIYWEEQHLWNHLADLPIGKINNAEAESTFDLTQYGYESNEGLAVFLYGTDNETTTMDEWYFLTYLSYSLTPMCGDTLTSVYIVADANGIVGLIGKTETKYYYGNSEVDEEGYPVSDDMDPIASYYTVYSVKFSDVGTTVVPEPAPYEKESAGLFGTIPYDALEAAMSGMTGTTNYTFRAEEVTTYAPSTDPSDYEISTSTVSETVKMATSGNPARNQVSSTGKVGTVGYVTPDAILLAKTGQYTATKDGNSYHTEFSGYKQFDGWYEEFSYDYSVDALHGTKRVVGGLLSDLIPQFDFSSAIFKYAGYTVVDGIGDVFTFNLRDGSISKELAPELSMDGNTRYAVSSVSKAFTIQVACNIDDKGNITNARLIKAVYPYNILDIYRGYMEITFDHFGTTVLDAPGSAFEGLFDGYVNREIMGNWSQYTDKYFYYLHTTNHTKYYGCYDESTNTWHCTNPDGTLREGSHVASGETVMKFIYGEDTYAKLPQAEVFLNVFGDNLFGPFYNDREKADGGYINYACVTTHSEEVDENDRIANYEEIIESLKTELGKLGFAVSQANTDMVGKIPGQSSRYVTFISENGKGNIEIVVENNYTKNFWIYFYVTGDWTLTK